MIFMELVLHPDAIVDFSKIVAAVNDLLCSALTLKHLG